jgi:hypothetical protein
MGLVARDDGARNEGAPDHHDAGDFCVGQSIQIAIFWIRELRESATYR